MNQSGDSHTVRPPQLLNRLDKMVQAGRIAPDDAARLRAAAESGGLDEAVQEIRLKHMKARLEAAVEDGLITRGEASVIFVRLENGEDPRLLRGLRRRAGPPPA